MQQVNGIQQHRRAHRPGESYDPAATTVILRAFPHGTLHGEGDKQGKGLYDIQDRVVGLNRSSAAKRCILQQT